jgi:uncharacterized protein YfcZ (UPF0381/DUF406 family)
MKVTKEEAIEKINKGLKKLEEKIDLSYEDSSNISGDEQRYMQGQRAGIDFALYCLNEDLIFPKFF